MVLCGWVLVLDVVFVFGILDFVGFGFDFDILCWVLLGFCWVFVLFCFGGFVCGFAGYMFWFSGLDVCFVLVCLF